MDSYYETLQEKTNQPGGFLLHGLKTEKTTKKKKIHTWNKNAKPI